MYFKILPSGFTNDVSNTCLFDEKGMIIHYVRTRPTHPNMIVIFYHIHIWVGCVPLYCDFKLPLKVTCKEKHITLTVFQFILVIHVTHLQTVLFVKHGKVENTFVS